MQQVTFDFLRQVLDERRSFIMNHMDKLHRIAASAAADSLLRQAFQTMMDPSYMRLDLARSQQLEFEIDKRFVAAYGDFYDLLFVDSTRFVFHSIRQESDYHTRLGDESESTLLSERLRTDPKIAFVDFEHYGPSDEPAAFHVVAVHMNGRRIGWLVFQHAINRINSVLTDRTGLGRTGEVYLVNSRDIMLTDSRFIKEPTMMAMHLNTEATRNARNRGAGSKLILDYRSRPVFSVHEQFSFLDVPWVIIAEIDEGEVITDHFRRRVDDFSPGIKAYVNHRPYAGDGSRFTSRSDVKVDMNEYGLVRNGGSISTAGVSTCTAIAITLPGQFSYLAHLSPTDDAYTKPITRSFLGDSRTDVLNSLLNRILDYEIYPYELTRLVVTVVATSDESLIGVLRGLVEHDVQLSQVKVMVHADALYANVHVDAGSGQATVEWFSEIGVVAAVETSDSVQDIGGIVSSLIRNGSLPAS